MKILKFIIVFFSLLFCFLHPLLYRYILPPEHHDVLLTFSIISSTIGLLICSIIIFISYKIIKSIYIKKQKDLTIIVYFIFGILSFIVFLLQGGPTIFLIIGAFFHDGDEGWVHNPATCCQ